MAKMFFCQTQSSLKIHYIITPLMVIYDMSLTLVLRMKTILPKLSK